MVVKTLCALCLTVGLLLTGCENVTRTDRESETFPFDFTVTDIAGNQHSLSDYHGKVVVVDLWGTWCPPCREEIPSFIKLQEKYGAQGFQMIGLNQERVQGQAALHTVSQFVARNRINYPCAMLTPEIREQVPNLEGFPTTLFIDKEGKVRKKLVGLHSYADLEKIVTELLAE